MKSTDDGKLGESACHTLEVTSHLMHGPYRRGGDTGLAGRNLPEKQHVSRFGADQTRRLETVSVSV